MMSVWPSYAKYVMEGFSESEQDPSVIRTEMERGVPKQRVRNSQVLMKITGNVLFVNRADIASFDDWYFDDIKRVGWFTMRHPRTGQEIEARLIGGKRGELSPSAAGFYVAQRQIEVEYLR